MKSILMMAAVVLATVSPAWAGDDHDDAPASLDGPALPRFVAESELFELVGVLDGQRLTLWLDRTADNSPVKDAKVELELGGEKVQVRVPVTAHGEGEFEATLAQPLAPGEIAVAATVMAGEETDLLAGELDLHAEVEAVAPAPAHDWREVALWAALAGAALGGLAWLIRRVSKQRRNQRAGGAA